MTTRNTGRILVRGIGIGSQPVSPPPDAGSFQVLAGGRDMLARAPWFAGERLPLAAPVSSWLDAVGRHAAQGRNVLVLADGDPLFFGIGRAVAQRFLEAEFRPGLSCLQEAASRLGLSWAGVPVVSLHGRDDWSPLWAAMTHHSLVGVYTDQWSSPDRMAVEARARDVRGWTMHVFSRLGHADETHAAGDLALAPDQDFHLPGPWFILLERTTPPPCVLTPGIPDNELITRGRPMTKGPVRAVGLAGLRLCLEDTVWDLGAGCGSVALEACVPAARGRVLAVEKDAGRAAILRENRKRFGAWMVEVVESEILQALSFLPVPDAVFVGGGVQNPGLLEGVVQALRPGGRLVVHAVLFKTMHTAMQVLAGRGLDPQILQVSCARGEQLAGDMRLVPLDPVFVISGRKPDFVSGDKV